MRGSVSRIQPTKALETKKFKADDLIGVIEGYHLIYDKEGSIGSIRDRRPLELPCDYFDLDNESEDYENVDEE